jgi:Na+/proline symporter
MGLLLAAAGLALLIWQVRLVGLDHIGDGFQAVGWRGFLVASFFAAFLSTLSTQLNWGASYLVHDGYQRFINRRAPEQHYVRVARILPYLLALGALIVAWQSRTIGESFTWILNLTAGIGPVYLLRWFWWRINPWSEIAAMCVSLPVLLLRSSIFAWLGLPHGLLPELLYMVIATAAVWLPATLLTPPVDRGTLKAFYASARPPGFWRPVSVAAPQQENWRQSIFQWILSTAALLATTIGPIEWMVGSKQAGLIWCAAGAAGWVVVWLSASALPSARAESKPHKAVPSEEPAAADSRHPSSASSARRR